ncbi:hypothetical protein [Fibrella forsythiae]|uniref:Uncharacterized protein n=1 Tax=Fibrella forsythiae TaxID=2817061 RepID=A0ABS3JBC9_9BACT|nr:hypothetical protein [Fibrella forsythiae]MBO0947303.1 hypothetical protein [Fibrella forsythiae]
MKQIVYLVTDKEQLPRMVTAIKVTPDCLLYELSQAQNMSTHYDFEISPKLDVMLSTTN